MSIASFAELDEASNIFVKFLFNLLKKIVKLQSLRKISLQVRTDFCYPFNTYPIKMTYRRKNPSIIEKYNSSITNIFPSKLYIYVLYILV